MSEIKRPVKSGNIRMVPALLYLAAIKYQTDFTYPIQDYILGSLGKHDFMNVIEAMQILVFESIGKIITTTVMYIFLE